MMLNPLGSRPDNSYLVELDAGFAATLGRIEDKLDTLIAALAEDGGAEDDPPANLTLDGAIATRPTADRSL